MYNLTLMELKKSHFQTTDDITKMAKELNSNQHNIDEQQQMETEVQQITEVVNELVVVPDVNKKNSERLKKLKKLKLVNIKRRQGKPRTTKKLDKYKYSPKPFLKKKSHEKNRSINYIII